jgi:hypothetical protein
MKKFAAACVLACALIAVIAGPAGAHTTTRGAAQAAGPITFGVADDTGKYADDGGAWFNQQLKGANLTEERWTLSWTGGTTINELPFLQRAAPQAQLDGIKVELALYGRPASNNDPIAFCAWAGQVAATAAKWGIHDFIVWNEPNTALYWSPQDDSAPAKYEALLAACYDTIHAADPLANVIGFGLSPRKGTSTQTSPIDFIKAAGDAYKASGRTKPIMDMLSVHPYPNPNNPTDGPDVGYKDAKSYGIPNLDRIKQAVYDAWNKTGQPTTLNGLLLVLDEVGWQTITAAYKQYIHDENVKVVDEATQAQFLQVATQKYFACDPTIATVNWFLLVDESTRDGKDATGAAVGGGWQSGLLTAGGKGVSTPKQAYSALAPLWAQGRSACTGPQINWKPAAAGDSDGGSGDSGGDGAGTGADPASVASLTTFLSSDIAQLFGSLQTQIQQIKALFATPPPFFQPGSAPGGLFGSANAFFAQIPILFGSVQSSINAQFGLMLSSANSLDVSRILQAFGPFGRKLSRSHAAATVLAKGSSAVKPGARLKLKLKANGKAKLKAGNAFAVIVLRDPASSAKPTVLFKKVGVVKATKPTKKPAKPTKKPAKPKKHGKK